MFFKLIYTYIDLHDIPIYLISIYSCELNEALGLTYNCFIILWIQETPALMFTTYLNR